MENPLITVIVPVYKVEDYLERCVDSIVNQTYKNLEIILVDDGSPDRCGEMCEEIAKTDSRIKVIHKENGGLSSARNAGLDIMTGDYVGFVDSDDWIEKDMYSELYKLIKHYDTKIAVGGIQCDYTSGKVIYFNPLYPDERDVKVFARVDALRELIFAKKISNSVCDKLFDKSVFCSRRFTEGIVNEDFDLMPSLIDSVESVVYNPCPYYHYMMTDESITRGEFKERRFILAEISRKNLLFYKEKYPELTLIAEAKHIELCIDLIYYAAKGCKKHTKRKEIISEIKKYSIRSLFNMDGNKNKLKFLLFKLNVSFYVAFLDLYHKHKSE